MAFMRARLGKMGSATSKSLLSLWEWCCVVWLFFPTACQRILMAAALRILIWFRIVGLDANQITFVLLHSCGSWDIPVESKNHMSWKSLVQQQPLAKKQPKHCTWQILTFLLDSTMSVHLQKALFPFVRHHSFQTQHSLSGGSRSVSKYLNPHVHLNRNAKSPSILLSWQSYSLWRTLSNHKKGHQGLTTPEENPACISRASSKMIISLWSF